MIDNETRKLLITLAEKYETAQFLDGDPSWFMHQVKGNLNQEVMAFLASCLSYGSRKQFLPKIQWLLTKANGDIDQWIRSGQWRRHVPDDDSRCFYRLYTFHHMHTLLNAYQQIMAEFGSLGEMVRTNASDTLSAIECICHNFARYGSTGVVPKDATSACKRVCMFMRWMVRDNSPVDLGLWAHFIDRRTLIMPLDTHVLTQACRLGLLTSKTASMSAAIRLSKALAEVFTDDPLRGDFALFGYGVNNPN
ncbi:MAG: TIGR02757 family protein [Muribaculaceae bacterium]|nr:TIGR02757 family protein [Muribaculaceae bacterium]